MIEPIEPLTIAARAATALCAIAWIGVWFRRAGLVPTRWLTALAIALHVACVPGCVEQVLAQAFPPENWRSEAYFDASRIVWRFEDRFAEIGIMALLLPIVAGLGCGRARRSWLHGFAEAATWCVVTLPLVWLWYLARRVFGFHSDDFYVLRLHIVDLAVGPYIALAAAACAVLLRRLARRGIPGGRLHWLALAGPLAWIAAHAHWAGYFHARAALPEINRFWCVYRGPPHADLWPAAPQLCGGRDEIEVECVGVSSVVWQERLGVVHVEAGDEGRFTAVPSAEALSVLYSKLWELEERTRKRRRTVGFWPARDMLGPELAAWLSVLSAIGLERVQIFAQLEHVEVHPLHGPLARRSSCPLGYLTAEDIDVVRTWGRFERVVSDGTFRAHQGDRPQVPIRGDGSPIDSDFEERFADWPK